MRKTRDGRDCVHQMETDMEGVKNINYADLADALVDCMGVKCGDTKSCYWWAMYVSELLNN